MLSGMNTMAQLIENIRIANQAKPRSLSIRELASIQQAKKTYRKMLKVDCTGCGYCMPCPQGINIPVILSLYNDTFMFKDPEVNVILYGRMFSPEQQASNCSECGECEEKCPQKIKVMDELKNAHCRLTS